MIQTDPLSLVFIACFVFAGTFLLATTLLGMGHAHGGIHVHAGHISHAHLGHGGHVGHTAGAGAGHAGAPGHPARVQVPHQQGAHAQAQDAPATTGHPALLSHVLESLNLSAILVFLFCFGLLGYLLHNAAHTGAVLTIIVAVLAGVGGAAAMNALLARLFGTEVGHLGADSSEMEGRLATVSMPIREGGVGEIIFVGENGTRRSLGARSLDGSAIARDAEVVIMSYRDGIAEVQSWDHFIASARNEAAAPPGRSA